jgi:hypothetical protein
MFTYKKFVNLLVFIVSILSVNLITDRITNYLLEHKHLTSPAKATLLGMFLTVAVLYPAFMWIDDLAEKIAKNFFKAGKNAAGKTIGVLIAFAVAIGILFLIYLHLWFGLYPWNLITR